MGGTRSLGYYINNFVADIKHYLNINAMIMMYIYKLILIESNNRNVSTINSTNYSWKTRNMEEPFLIVSNLIRLHRKFDETVHHSV